MKIYMLAVIALLLAGCSTKYEKDLVVNTAMKEKVDPLIIKSICYMESGLKPYAINVNASILNIQKGPHFFNSASAANIYMDTVLDPMGLNYDIGICQINKQHLKKFNLDNEDLLDIETNVSVASKIHYQNMIACKQDITCALSLYNTGKKNSIQGFEYAKKVVNIRKTIK